MWMLRVSLCPLHDVVISDPQDQDYSENIRRTACVNTRLILSIDEAGTQCACARAYATGSHDRK